ncbi:alpha-L-fucosidase 2 [Cnuella takakiae]|uniref:Alpha-L-fucosidase 2 n=2 Tax=Cnuella takakiae TaxID=1302690 RepID=A0A1M4T344_9BACT|nr:alpha-L-fucosidase 2 [Cnuella takakiae]
MYFKRTGTIPRKNSLVSILALFLFATTLFAQTGKDLELWYQHPAGSWNEALPVGNGRLGAMVFGGIASERLQLNEESIWSGRPEDFVHPEAKAALPQVRKLLFAGQYAAAQKLAEEKMMGPRKSGSSYQTLGDLLLDFVLPNGELQGYRRELDLETAIARVQYRVGNVGFQREIFSSAPAKALVVRLTADKKGALNFSVGMRRSGNKAAIDVAGQTITLSEHVGNGVGVRLVSKVQVIAEGGTINPVAGKLQVTKADAVTLLLTAATDYWGKDPQATADQELQAAAQQTYADLKQAHIADYQRYFKRVDLDLGTNNSTLFPMDARIAALQQGNEDPQLLELYYQFGRYLLISSSRPGGLPANLQGIWADGLNPPWDADYHININIQMNYWPAEVANLSELHQPFLDFLNALRADGRKTARDMYGLKGTVAHFTTDAWHFTETYGKPQWAMWPMGMAWSARHLWEHYQFTADKDYLAKQAYPALKEAAEFCMAWLTPNPATGHLVSGPSISPENTFTAPDGSVATMVMGPTMDHMIIRELLGNTLAAARVLNMDKAFQKQLEQTSARLAPTKIGSDGRIMEWTEEFKEPEPGHRHISHLYGLHPGNEINRQTPELLAAARKTIDHRLANGGGHTGWSRAWIVNFFARLQDGDAAYQNLVALLQKSTLPNLLDNHPPFQIDGNFGATAGISEMLLQSHAGEIELLPAMPKAWQQGYIHGIVARGGFEVDIDWEGGKLKGVKLLSRNGGTCKLRYGNQVVELNTEKGGTYRLGRQLQKL